MRKIWLITHLLTLGFGFESIKETVQFNCPDKSVKPDFTLLSYNVGTFHLDRFTFAVDKDTMIYVDTTNIFMQKKWLDSVNTDVVCFQEFFNSDQTESESIIRKMVSKGYHYYYTNPVRNKCFVGFFGVITFSKFPIIKADSISYTEEMSLNRGIYTDIKIGNDTVRIINIHLHSMSIRLKRAENIDEINTQLAIVKEKLRFGFAERERQIDTVLEVTDKCRFPLLLCGDFNDVPYSYSYQTTKKKLKNSFETAGKGFGFTYNKFPFFIRIDNQFYNKGLAAVSFRVRKNKKSDHFPIEGGYVFI